MTLLAAVPRVLIAHPDQATRLSLELSVRRVFDGEVAVYHSGGLTEALQMAGEIDPSVVILLLDGPLALDIASELRRPGRRLVGLYDPVRSRGREADLLRHAVRAGVDDFVPLPVADAELDQALAVDGTGRVEHSDSAPAASRKHQEPGGTVAFLSHRGGAGSSTLAASTALIFAGSQVFPGGTVLCDAVLQLGTSAAILGLAAEQSRGQDMASLADDLDAEPETLGSLASYMLTESETGLRLLASPADPALAAGVTPDHLSRILIRLRRGYPCVLVDLPPVLDLLTLSALDLCEQVVVTTEATAPAVLGCRRFLKLLESEGFGDERIRLVVNRHQASDCNLEAQVIADELGRDVDLVLAWDLQVIAAENQGWPLVLSAPEAAFSEAVGGLAGQLAVALGAVMPSEPVEGESLQSEAV